MDQCCWHQPKPGLESKIPPLVLEVHFCQLVAVLKHGIGFRICPETVHYPLRRSVSHRQGSEPKRTEEQREEREGKRQKGREERRVKKLEREECEKERL